MICTVLNDDGDAGWRPVMCPTILEPCRTWERQAEDLLDLKDVSLTEDTAFFPFASSRTGPAH